MAATARRNRRPLMKGSALLLAVTCAGLVWAVLDPASMAETARLVRDGASSLASQITRQADAALGGTEARDGWPVALSGQFQPADDVTAQATGALTLDHAVIRAEQGLAIRTEPVRIAFGHEQMDADRTWAAALGAPRDAQIELRRARAVEPDRRERLVAPPATPLCGGRLPGVVALWPGDDHLVMAIWPEGVGPGPEASPRAACGVWRYRR